MRRKRYLAPWARRAVAGEPANGMAGGNTRAADVAALQALEGKPAIYHCI